MDYSAPAEEMPTFTPEPPTVQRGQGGMGAGAIAGAAAVGAMAAAGAATAATEVESRIKRRGDGGAARRQPPGGGGPKPRKRPAKRPAKRARKGGSRAGKGKGAGAADGLPPWAGPAAAAAGGVLLLGVVLILVFSGGEKEPEPEPTPAPEPAEVGDIEVATPPPPPPKPEPVEEEVTPPPMEGFYSRGSFVSYQAKEVSAQLTSFTKTNVAISYKANHASGGLSHTLSLEGRFKLKISDGGGNMNGRAFTAGVTPGKPSRVYLRYDGQRLTVSVNGKRAGSWAVPDSGGFPRWRFELDPDVTISGLSASAQVEE